MIFMRRRKGHDSRVMKRNGAGVFADAEVDDSVRANCTLYGSLKPLLLVIESEVANNVLLKSSTM